MHRDVGVCRERLRRPFSHNARVPYLRQAHEQESEREAQVMSQGGGLGASLALRLCKPPRERRVESDYS